MRHRNIIILSVVLLMASGLLRAQYEVAPVPFNTSYADEVVSALFAGDLIYCSNRNQHLLRSRTDRNEEYLFRLYIAHQKGSHRKRPQIWPKELLPDAHLGPAALSSDGKTLYLTVNNEAGNGIFIARKEGDRWSQPRPFEHNSPEYTTAHPSVSKDGNRLFFASDMPGGFGGFDIYCCEHTATGWSKPVNLGATINSAANELYPFLQSEHQLFFASSGHETMGGLDIFSAIEWNGQWLSRQHHKEPVNSPADDFAYSAADPTSGYFSSNRNGKSVDIFSFKSVFPVFTDCNEQEENDYTYLFTYNISEKDTTDNFTYRWDFDDGTTATGDSIQHSFPATGTYSVKLYVTDLLTEEETIEAEYDVSVEDVEQPYITLPEKAAAGENLTLDASHTYLPEVNIESYYWEPGDGTQIQLKEPVGGYSYTIPGVYQIRLGIIGTQKNTGEKVKNCILRTIEITP
ncbi:MAG: PKD domain-containing protein [Bacteroidales bacterium]|jgi:hypothetical protein|nr:PKD domain-containing protein [Bacteroidales bacterium]